MIKKSFEIEIHESVIDQAGFKVARKTAKTINKTFGNFSDVYILHNVFISPNSIIDHIILYKNAIILIESRSCHGSIRINNTGEWSRERMLIKNPIQFLLQQQNILSEKLESEVGNFISQDTIKVMEFYKIISQFESCKLYNSSTISKLITPRENLISQIHNIISATNENRRRKLWQLKKPHTPSDEDLETLAAYLRNEHYKNVPLEK